MAVEAGLGFIGLISGAFGIVSSIQGWLPDPGPHATVRVYAGLCSNKAEGTGGNVPGVALWDADGGLVGFEDGTKHKVAEGEFHDIQVASNKRPAEYIAISNGGKDGICIAALAVTQPDGNQQFGWTGDVARRCGAPWYPQNAIMGTSQGNNHYRPSCVWIDRDGSNSPYQGMSVHLPDFTTDSQDQADVFSNSRDLMCHSVPRFTMWHKFITQDTIPIFETPPAYNENGTDADANAIIHPRTKQAESVVFNDAAGKPSGPSALESLKELPSSRRHRRRQINPAMQGRLIVSDIDSHSAKELCRSDTSHGPDFVSTVEGLFCDMSEKQIWPLCSSAVTQFCFDMTSNMLKAGSSQHSGNWTIGSRAAGPDVTVPDKAYTHVANWG